MPKTGKDGHARPSEIPATLERSDQKAQDTYAKAYDAAAEEYSDEERVARTAWSALKRTHEKVGDHWEPKDEHGPSDEASAQRGRGGTTHGGVDANATKEHLYEQAQRLGIEGRSDMTKEQLVAALEEESGRRSREAREQG